jgi:glycosyltransferase involved in cell wall biosynthesis
MKNNKPVVQVITKYFYPVAAGIETNILETYKVFVRDGWDVTIHTSVDTLTEKNVLEAAADVQGLKVTRYPFRWFSYFPQFDWDKTDIVALHNFNVIPHLFYMMTFAVRRLLGKKSPKLVLTPHGGFNPEWAIFSKPVAAIKSFYHYTIGTLMINISVDAMRAVSEWERIEIIKKGVKSEIVHTISNGIEDEAYMDVDKLASKEIKETVKSWGRYIVQIGRVYMIKNYETTIRALPLMDPDIKFVIVGPIGDLNYQDSIIALAKSLGVENRLILAGVIRGVDKYYLIKHSQLMIHMALWESFCNAVHEGLSQGKICVVADNTALPLLIKNEVNGYCVSTLDHKEVAKKVMYVINNLKTKKFLKMSEVNRKFGLEDSWVSTSRKMQKLYRKIIE